jgi:hypothetical protein
MYSDSEPELLVSTVSRYPAPSVTVDIVSSAMRPCAFHSLVLLGSTSGSECRLLLSRIRASAGVAVSSAFIRFVHSPDTSLARGL